MKKAKKKFVVKPGLFAACVELASDPTAGGLLCQIVLLSETKTLKDHKGETGWLSLSRPQWWALTGFTRHQHDRAVRVLKKGGLVESFRRKLRYDDPAALAWVRITEKTKSGIEEIRKRDGISAFAENTSSIISVVEEEDGDLNSAGTESLIEMNKLKNEKEENVIVEKIITEPATLSQKEISEKSKGNNVDKKWFVKTVSKMYEGCNYTPEPYQYSACKVLRDMVDWLVTDPGEFHSAHKDRLDPVVEGLKDVINNWSSFCMFSEMYFKTYNCSLVPQIWSLKHQQKTIPDYIKFLAYFRQVQEEAEKEGHPIPKDQEQSKFFSDYFFWLEASNTIKPTLLSKTISNIKKDKMSKLLSMNS